MFTVRGCDENGMDTGELWEVGSLREGVELLNTGKCWKVSKAKPFEV